MMISSEDHHIMGAKAMMESDKNCLRVILIILLIPALFLGALIWWSSSMMKFKHIYYYQSDEEKAAANGTLMPDLANYIERSGLRGFQDTEEQIETVTFGSLDELTEAIPALKCYTYKPTTNGKDIKGKKVKIYEIDSVTPFSSKTSVLPLNFNLIEPDSQKLYWNWKYSICEYKDGSCRFVILVCPR